MMPKLSKNLRSSYLNRVCRRIFSLSLLIGGVFTGVGATGEVIDKSQPYRLDIDIAGIPDSAMFMLGGRTACADTAMVLNGKASFELNIEQDYPVSLRLIGPMPIVVGAYKSISVLGQNGYHERISGKYSDFDCDKVKYEGAPWSHDLVAFNDYLYDKQAEIRNVKDSVEAAVGKDERNRLRLKTTRLYAERDSMAYEFILEHPNSYLSLSYMSSLLKRLPVERISAVYDKLLPEYRDSHYGELLASYVSTKVIEVGDNLADYDIEGLIGDGSRLRLSDMTSDYIVLMFTAAGCGPCVMMGKEIETLDYNDRIGLIAYSMDDGYDVYKMTDSRAAGKFPVIWNGGKGRDSEACIKYSVNMIPSVFIFGPDRKLIEKFSGYYDGRLKRILDKYLLNGGKHENE